MNLPPIGRILGNHFGSIFPGRGSAARRGDRPPPDGETARRITPLDHVMHIADIIPVPPPRGSTWGRGHHTATGNQGDNVAFYDGQNNVQVNQARVRRDRANAENAVADCVNREASHGRAGVHGRDRSRGGRGRGRGNGIGRFDGLSNNESFR